VNNIQIPAIVIGTIVLLIVLALVKKGYVKQGDKPNMPAVIICLGIAIVGGLLASLGKT
jgi:hypothetical protein